MKIDNITNVETSLMNWSEVIAYVESDAPAVAEGYPAIRIPGIIALDDGTLLTYNECRQGDDWSAIDVGLRRSNDGGKTWSERQIIADGKGRNAANNPVMIPDGDTVHFLYCENYKRVFYCRSDDRGVTWSQRRELTDDLAIPFIWSVIALGPGHGLRLQSGRLVVPIWVGFNKKRMFAHYPTVSGCIYSDDDGETWLVSEMLDLEGENLNECAMAELPDGTLLVNIRGSKTAHCRRVSSSTDGGVTWEKPRRELQLTDPACASGFLAVGDTLYFTNCNDPKSRVNLTLRRSADGGKTWEDCLLIAEKAGYSDLCYYDGALYVIFESEEERYIHCARIAL